MSSQNYRIDLTKSVTTWSMSLKLKRGFWEYFVKPFFMMLPGSANKLRISILKMAGAKIGHTCLIEAKANILMPWNLEIGNFVVIGRETNIYNYAPIKISDMTVVSQRCFLCTGTHDYTHPYMPLIWEPVTIGSQCWLAAEVFVGPGVEVGDGSVVGARSVVTKDIPEWVVAAGNPCRTIKPRVVIDYEN